MFGRKRREALRVRAELLAKINGREIVYITRRDPKTYVETTIGRSGVINIVEDMLVVSCGNDMVVRAAVEDIKIYELMNLSGVNFVIDNAVYIAYYTKEIKPRSDAAVRPSSKG